MAQFTRFLLGSASVLLTTLPSAAFAQATEPGADEIVVTAQRRAERLQDVPLAVSAFSPNDLSSKQVQTTLDLPRLVPNMIGATNVGIGSANSYFIRGLGNTESIATFDPPVGTYVDDIYVSRQNANNFALFDVERIEVLRGPQGTLFGRNTTGGAINVILRKPSSEAGGYVEASYGRYDSYSVRGSVDVPISEKVLTKVSGFVIGSNGYVRNITTGEKNNGQDGWGVRGAVRLLPTDSITWDISADYIRDDQVNVPAVLDENGHRISSTGLSKHVASLQGLVTGRKAGFKFGNVVKNFAATSNLQFETDGATISLITGYRDLKQDYLTDIFDGPHPTGGFALSSAGRFKQFSQEVKVNGELFDDRLQYVAGLFYIHEDNRTDFADVFTIDLGDVGVPLVLADRTLRNKTSAPAAYAQIDYEVVDGLTVTAGARYTQEKKRFTVEDNGNPLVGSPYDTDDIAAAGTPLRQKISLLTPRLALQYKFNQDTMIFASATRGFRSGGWNARALTFENFLIFGPEKVWSYEGGIRSEFLDRRVRLNATAFYTDVHGFQVPLGFIDSTGAVNFVTQNGSDFRNYGLETELQVVPVTGLTLFANGGWQKAKYLNPTEAIRQQQADCRAGNAAACGQGIVAPDGSLATPQRTPKFTLSFGGSYDVQFGDYVLTPSANASYQSKLTVGTAATPNDQVGAQWLVGASLNFAPQDGPWRVSVECSNCLDNTYVASSFPPIYRFYNMPRIWRANVAYRF